MVEATTLGHKTGEEGADGQERSCKLEMGHQPPTLLLRADLGAVFLLPLPSSGPVNGTIRDLEVSESTGHA